MTANASKDLPYSDESANIIYNLLFCDNLSLYQELTEQPYSYPFDILFAPEIAEAELQKIAVVDEFDPRVKLLACNRLLAAPMAGPALKVAAGLMNHITVNAQ
jgi:hypothetical protein